MAIVVLAFTVALCIAFNRLVMAYDRRIAACENHLCQIMEIIKEESVLPQVSRLRAPSYLMASLLAAGATGWIALMSGPLIGFILSIAVFGLGCFILAFHAARERLFLIALRDAYLTRTASLPEPGHSWAPYWGQP